MKQFFGAFFGSVVGIIVATLLAVLVIVAAVKSSISEGFKPADKVALRPNSVLQLVINGSIEEREIEDPLEALGQIGISRPKETGLNVLIKKIKYAKTDKKVKGIYIKIKNLEGGYANITELRTCLNDFRKSGKFIYCYGENYSQREYYLASVADKVFLNPLGMIEFKGLSMNLLFLKNMFDKLGINIQTFRHGRYKSAIEPLILDKMSQANRQQTEMFLNSIWNTMLEGISESRKVSVEDLNSWADNLAIETPDDAVKLKLIDAKAYEDEVLDEVRKKAGVSEEGILNLIGFNKYEAYPKLTKEGARNRIAIIYANGAIYGGEGSDEEIGSDRLSKAIKEARMDDRVKAIVLRVNSPGGSALASDVIWREVNLAKQSKPFIVSMGDVAASGGYYISCAAHWIFAEPNTITGSIGVFGLIPDFQKALSDKLGITADTVNTNKHSSMGNALYPVSQRERVYIQNSVENIYNTFIGKVSEGRKIPVDLVDSIGQGRVWSGKDALAMKLVDELGGVMDAVKYAARKANVADYRIVELPRPKNPLEAWFGKAEDDAETRIMKKNLGPAYVYLKQIQNVINLNGVQARLPFEIIIK